MTPKPDYYKQSFRFPAWTKITSSIVVAIFTVLIALNAFTINPWTIEKSVTSLNERADATDLRLVALETSNAGIREQVSSMAKSIDSISTDVKQINQNLLTLMRYASHAYIAQVTTNTNQSSYFAE